MQPHEAMQYLTQLANDYVRTLSPSAAMPTQQVAQQAIDALAPLVQAASAAPQDERERPALSAVE